MAKKHKKPVDLDWALKEHNRKVDEHQASVEWFHQRRRDRAADNAEALERVIVGFTLISNQLGLLGDQLRSIKTKFERERDGNDPGA